MADDEILECSTDYLVLPAVEPGPEVPVEDYPVYRQVLAYLTEKQEFSAWLVDDHVTELSDQIAVVVRTCQGQSSLNFNRQPDSGHRHLKLGPLADRIQSLIPFPREEPSGYLSLSRVGRSPGHSEVLVCVVGRGVGWARYLLVTGDRVVEADLAPSQ